MQGDGIQMGCRASDNFQIGNFVWGKIHGDLWWPGQVCNPPDASEEARNSKHPDHHVLVAYFGVNTFAWCVPSELKSFKEEFEQIVDQNSSQSFISAVKDAMHEIESCLRSDMTCYCVPPEKVVQFRINRNNGIGKASIANYSPATFLNHLHDVAQDVSVANMLDVTMLRSWAASFYLRNGCFFKMIEDLFDEKQTDLNALPENCYKDKHGQEYRISGGRVVKGPLISGDEAYRKKRSMAELILLADPEVVQHIVVEEDKLGTVENETKGHINLGLLQNQKKKKREKEKQKAPVAKVTRVMYEEEHDSTRRERKKSKYLSPPYTTGYTERSNSFKSVDFDVSDNDSESSQHLRSKFPAYIGGCEASTKDGDPMSHLSNYNEASAHVILRKLLFAASNPLHLGRTFPAETVMEFFVKHRILAFSGILDFESLAEQRGNSDTFGNHPLHVMESNEVSSGKKRNDQKDESNLENALGIHENKRKAKKDQATTETIKSYCLNGVDASTGRSRYRGKSGADEALSNSVEKLHHISINNLGEGKIEKTRSKTTGKVNDGKARQTGNEHLISFSHKRKSNDDCTNGERNAGLCHIMYDNPGKSLKSKRTKHVVDNNENSVALLLTFSPGSTLPSKDELFSVFIKYGALKKQETELFRDPGCARVVFARASDAKKALNGIRKSKNFPFLVVDCQSFDLPQCTDCPSPSQSDSKNSSLSCISRDLQRMIHTLSPKKGLTSHGLKPEIRKDLINDIKGLLNKVKKLISS